MNKPGLINVILLVRLVIYALIFLIITVLNIVFDGPTQKELLLNLTLAVSFFSIFSFISSKALNYKFIFYLQPIFDTLLLAILVVHTGHITSPFVIFFSIIFFYMGFLDGKLGGGVEVIILSISLIVVHFIWRDQIDLGQNYQTSYLLAQYSIAFVIILILSAYLHGFYQRKAREQAYIQERFDTLKRLHDGIISNINIGIILMSDTSTILSCNPAGISILDKREHELVGKKLIDVFSYSGKEEDIIRYENKFLGYRYQEFLSKQPDIKGRLLVFQDVTEKEKLKEELGKQEKLAALGQFSSVIAHEIKNPLGAIKGSLQLVKKKIPVSNKLMNIIEREMNRLDLILNNLLMVSRPAAKEETAVNLPLVIGEFLDAIDSYEMFDELSCELKGETDVSVFVSSNELKQVLWNLIVNSYEVKPDAKIIIDISSSADVYVLQYSDNGKGIEPFIKQEVTQPFFTTKKTGTGLGLYVIKMICEKYRVGFKLYTNEQVNGFMIELTFNKYE